MTSRTRTDTRALVGPTTGFAAVGVSVFVMLASGPRLLGAQDFSVMAVAWSLLTIFAVGVAYPAEQAVTTIVAGQPDPGQVQRVLRRAAALAALTAALPLAAATGLDPLLDGSVLWSATVTTGAFAWVVNVVPRGRLAGAGRFHAYGVAPITEAGTRVLLCGAAWLLPRPDIWLAMAVVVPLLAAAWAARHRVEARPVAPSAHGTRPAPAVAPATGNPRPAPTSSFAALAAVSLSFVTIMNAAPLVIQWRLPGAAAGQFVSAMTYMRIPMLLTTGFLTVVLSATAAAWARRDRRELGRAIGVAATGSALALGFSAAVWAVSGPALTLYYGATIELGAGVLALLGAATTLAVAASLFSQIGLGALRQARLALVWTGTAALTIAGLLIWGTSPLSITAVVAAGLFGCFLAAVGIALALRPELEAKP